mmetsp:Transcript_12596/g.20949  ORF Transcript_12596/g.20949 Transcript_12596/m.20949 type:complete len:275 (-) Transcript_12596:54-878(-)
MKFMLNYRVALIALIFCLNNYVISTYLHIPATQHHRSFLKDTYKVKGDDKQVFHVRQVPGDGGCLFHAITAWITYLQTNKHMDFDWRMRNLSQKLRHLAVHILQQNNTLVIENGDVMDSSLLLEMVSDIYDLNTTEYCQQILDPRTWGGGPEIVALSNHFKCPIHVYQLCTSRSFMRGLYFSLELCGKFGSPNFDEKSPMYLLCADGRFPNIKPGRHNRSGDHFLALFPVTAAAATPASTSTSTSTITSGSESGRIIDRFCTAGSILADSEHTC